MADRPIEVHGLKELDRKLGQLPPEIVGKGASGPLASSLREATKPLIEAIRPKIPAGETGRLRKALKARREKSPQSFKGRPNELYHVGIDLGRNRADPRGAWWWWFVEKGTKKMAARPYLRPGNDESKGEQINTFSKRLAKRIELIEKKLGAQ